jgi:outer membrane protein TolC
MTVLDTQRALSDVQNDMGILKLKRLQATVSLYKALGGGWKDDQSQGNSLSIKKLDSTRKGSPALRVES